MRRTTQFEHRKVIGKRQEEYSDLGGDLFYIYCTNNNQEMPNTAQPNARKGRLGRCLILLPNERPDRDGQRVQALTATTVLIGIPTLMVACAGLAAVLSM